MWKQFTLVKESRGRHGIKTTHRALYRTIAEEGFDLVEQVTKLRRLQEELHMMGSIVAGEDFATILVSSLPESWDIYTSAYLGKKTNGVALTPRIGKCRERAGKVRVTRARGVGICSPRLYEYCRTGLNKILGHYTPLKKNFLLSNWAAATFNLGPKTECFPHEDYGNLAFRWCSATALGRFNPKKGGHIILLESRTGYRVSSRVFCPDTILYRSPFQRPDLRK
jgi:hypothetical protein